MDMRSMKQAIYGGIFLALILLFLTWFYFLVVKPAPSCFDKKQNQNEEGIDCGGVCSQICLPANLQPVSLVDRVQIFFPAEDKITLLARLKNPNATHGGTVSYVLNLYDNQDKLITTLPGETIVYPNEVRYLISPAVQLSNPKQVSRADLQVRGIEWQPAEILKEPQVVVRDQNVEVNGKFLAVRGNLTNNDIVDIPKVTVIAVFFNQFQFSIGAAQTEIQNLRSGETRSFTINHPVLPSLSTQRTQVFLTTE